MPDPSVPLTLGFFANPSCPPSISSAALALDPAVGSKEEHPGISPTFVGEEANLPIGPPVSSDGGIKDAIANEDLNAFMKLILFDGCIKQFTLSSSFC